MGIRLNHLGLAFWVTARAVGAQEPPSPPTASLSDETVLAQTRSIFQTGLRFSETEILRAHARVQECGVSHTCAPEPERLHCQIGLDMLSGSYEALRRTNEASNRYNWLMTPRMKLYNQLNQQMMSDTAAALGRIKDRTNGRPCLSAAPQPGG